MAKKLLVDIDLAKNSINNARIQNLAADPSSPVVGQMYFNTGSNKLRTYNGSSWDEYGTSTATGNVTKASNSAQANTLQVSGGADKSIVDYAPGGTGLVKVASTGVPSLAVASDIPNIAESQVTNLTSDLAAKAPLANPTFTGTVTVPTPSNGTDAANKSYVDLAVQGITWKSSVRAATTAAGTLSSSFANGSAVDGVTLATGDRILIKNQSTGSENGIYVVAASGAPTRATDADANSEMQQAAVFVREGTTNADSAWVCSNDGAITLGTTSLTFVQFSTAGGVQNATTTTAGITRYATTAEAIAASISSAAVTPAGLATYTKKYSQTIGDGSSTSIAVTHNLGTQDVIAQLRDASTNAVVECDIVMTSTTVTTFSFATAPASNAYRAVIQG